MVVFGCVILPLWLSLLFRNDLSRIFFVIVLRLLGFLGGLGLAQSWEDNAKKCFTVGLLACYFVVLVLESGLHIWNQPKDHPSDPSVGE